MQRFIPVMALTICLSGIFVLTASAGGPTSSATALGVSAPAANLAVTAPAPPANATADVTYQLTYQPGKGASVKAYTGSSAPTPDTIIGGGGGGGFSCTLTMGPVTMKYGTTVYEAATDGCTQNVGLIQGLDDLYRGANLEYLLDSDYENYPTWTAIWSTEGACANSTWQYRAYMPWVEVCAQGFCVNFYNFYSAIHYYSC